MSKKQKNDSVLGFLYIVATPIGNLQDISLRALQVLKTVDLIAVEDSRKSKKLLNHYDIPTKTISLHDYNEAQRSRYLLNFLKTGKNIALISDAGTPLISDPGYRITKMAHDCNIKVVPIPGACAAITALSVSGLPTDRFVFEGFLPNKSVARQKRLLELCEEPRTMIFYESPKRLLDTLQDMLAAFGGGRMGVLARELTKTFETISKNSLKNLLTLAQSNPLQRRGELIVLVEGGKASAKTVLKYDQGRRILRILSKELSPSQAVKLTAQILERKIDRKTLYRLMMESKR